MWPSDRLQKLFGIEHPIVQAPMSGASTPAMAAAVANAGGLGSLGCALLSADEIRKTGAGIAVLTNRAINYNFFVHPAPDLSGYDFAPMRAGLAPLFAQTGAGDIPTPTNTWPLFDDARLEALLLIAPKIVSFHFGLPSAHAITALKAVGAVLIGNATCVAEALVLEEAGMDAIVAQGAEAGGHRGAFIGAPEDNDMGTLALAPLIVDAVDVPVIAAGGIFDGRGVAAAFMLGASGAQIGTAFLRSPESSITPAHRAALAETEDNRTKLTRVFSGRPARSIRNRATDALAAFEDKAAPFPAQRTVMAPLAKAGAALSSGDYQSLWSGQAGPRAKEATSAEIFRAICDEAVALLS